MDLHSNPTRSESLDHDFQESARMQSLQEALVADDNEINFRLRQWLEDENNSDSVFGRNQWIEDDNVSEPWRRQWIQDEFDTEHGRNTIRMENDVLINYIMADIIEMILTAVLQESFIEEPVPLQPVSAIILKGLPIVELDEDKLTRYTRCSICLEDFVLKEKVINLTCNHFYHEVCIKLWFERQNMCPICKQLFVSPN